MSKNIYTLVLQRQSIQDFTVVSKMILYNHFKTPLFTCIGIENLKHIIPQGTYPLSIYASPKFGYDVLLLANVKGRSFIEVHKANKASQLLGCIAPNLYFDADKVAGVNSATVFDALIFLAKKVLRSKNNILQIEVLNID